MHASVHVSKCIKTKQEMWKLVEELQNRRNSLLRFKHEKTVLLSQLDTALQGKPVFPNMGLFMVLKKLNLIGPAAPRPRRNCNSPYSLPNEQKKIYVQNFNLKQLSMILETCAQLDSEVSYKV